MALQDKYINPFTDFGFKKLFEAEIARQMKIKGMDLALISEITGLPIDVIEKL